jgi:hypothetical protein
LPLRETIPQLSQVEWKHDATGFKCKHRAQEMDWGMNGMFACMAAYGIHDKWHVYWTGVWHVAYMAAYGIHDKWRVCTMVSSELHYLKASIAKLVGCSAAVAALFRYTMKSVFFLANSSAQDGAKAPDFFLGFGYVR